MKVELVGVSQGISLSSSEETLNYLEFSKDGGKPFRVPIPTGTLELLVQELFGTDQEPEQPAQVSPPAPPVDGDVFEDEQQEEEFALPQSEDDIQSI